MRLHVFLIILILQSILFSCLKKEGSQYKIMDEEALRKIEQQGLDFNRYEFARQAEEGNAENVLLFLKAGMPPNPVFKAESPLARAIIEGHSEVVRILLEHQADPEIGRRQNDVSPLMYAAENGHTDLVNLLMEYGADIHRRQGKYTGGFNALMYAAANGHTDIIGIFLDKGVNINQKAKNTRKTALHLAVENREVETVRYLLKKGADKSLKDKKGRTPMDVVNEGIKDGFDPEPYLEIKKILENG